MLGALHTGALAERDKAFVPHLQLVRGKLTRTTLGGGPAGGTALGLIVGWALLKLFQRMQGLGLGENRRVPLPFRQQDLADALGLSLVHTNKTLARLRSEGVANWSNGHLTVPDAEALATVAVTDLDGDRAAAVVAEIGECGGAARAWTLDVADPEAVGDAPARLLPEGRHHDRRPGRGD